MAAVVAMMMTNPLNPSYIELILSTCQKLGVYIISVMSRVCIGETSRQPAQRLASRQRSRLQSVDCCLPWKKCRHSGVSSSAG